MAHFAKLDEHNVVLEVNVVNNETISNLPFPNSEPLGVAFLTEWSGGYTNWKQTSYNASFRKNYAGIGFTYSAELDAFVPPKPFPSWLLNTNTCQWEAPIPYPNDGNLYIWDEATQSWVPVNV
jgi:hypothetical protein